MTSNSNLQSQNRASQQSYVCDQCYRCKVKCSREQPSCIRCQQNNRSCTYSLGMWKGQPKGSSRKQQEKEHSLQLSRTRLESHEDENSSDGSVIPSAHTELDDDQEKEFDKFFSHSQDSETLMEDFLYAPSTGELNGSNLHLESPFLVWESTEQSSFSPSSLPNHSLDCFPMNIDPSPSLESNSPTKSNNWNKVLQPQSELSIPRQRVEDDCHIPDFPTSSSKSQSSESLPKEKRQQLSNHRSHTKSSSRTRPTIDGQFADTLGENPISRRHSSHRGHQRTHPYERTHRHSRSANLIQSMNSQQRPSRPLTPASTPDFTKISVSSRTSTPPSEYLTFQHHVRKTKMQEPKSLDSEHKTPSCNCLSSTIGSLENFHAFSQAALPSQETLLSLAQNTISTCEIAIRCPCRDTCWSTLRSLFVMQEVYQLLQQLCESDAKTKGIENKSPSSITKSPRCTSIQEEEEDCEQRSLIEQQFQIERVRREVMRAVMVLAGLEMLLVPLASRGTSNSGVILSLKTLSADLSKRMKTLLEVGDE